MGKFILDLWRQSLIQLELLYPSLVRIIQSWVDDIWAAFPLGWLRPTSDPYRVWILSRSVKFINEALDWIENVLGILPGVVLGAVLIDQVKIDPKLKQRVMTLDQVALLPAKVIIDLGFRKYNETLPREFNVANAATKLEKLLPAKVIIDLGFRKYNETLPREFNVANAATKLEKLFDFLRGKSKNFLRLILGSNWGRVVRVAFLLIKWGQVFAYLLLLWRYLKVIETDPDSLLFSAKLWNKNPRRKERGIVRRRIGGVKP